MTSSRGKAEALDLAHGLPVTSEDVAAQRRARALTSVTWTEYEAFLATQPLASYDELRARPAFTGEPFRLTD